MVLDKKEHETLAREIRSKLGFNRITITQLAKEVNRNRVTVSVWLQNNTTQERFDIMDAAIKRIIAKGENK